MDNLFELLPFIIGILYFVFGRKKKKDSAKPTQARPKTSQRTSTLEDILRELTGDTSSQTPEIKPIEPIKESKPEPIKISSKKSSSLGKDNYVDRYNHNSDTGKPIAELRKEIREEKGILAENGGFEFDLRQAVINDAILNRPHQ